MVTALEIDASGVEVGFLDVMGLNTSGRPLAGGASPSNGSPPSGSSPRKGEPVRDRTAPEHTEDGARVHRTAHRRQGYEFAVAEASHAPVEVDFLHGEALHIQRGVATMATRLGELGPCECVAACVSMVVRINDEDVHAETTVGGLDGNGGRPKRHDVILRKLYLA